jgi:hypothetical protein
VIIIKPINKFKTFKFDAAPFFFFIDIFPADYSNEDRPHLVDLVKTISSNPIMPLPMRVDRVFNGERSVLIRPEEPISFPITKDLTAFVNPVPLLQLGFEKLLYFTEVRAREKFVNPLNYNRVAKWWNKTKFLFGRVPALEVDFSAFMKGYLYTMVKAEILGEDLINAAKEYCQLISDICRKRFDQNSVLIEVKGQQENVKMYKIKDHTYYKKFKKTQETKYHPELIDIEICDLSSIGFTSFKDDSKAAMKKAGTKVIKYIPLLFYDDLLECMIQNLKRIEENSDDIIDPSILLEKKVIITEKSKDLEGGVNESFQWMESYDSIEFNPIIQTIMKNYQEYLLTLDPNRI